LLPGFFRRAKATADEIQEADWFTGERVKMFTFDGLRYQLQPDTRTI